MKKSKPANVRSVALVLGAGAVMLPLFLSAKYRMMAKVLIYGSAVPAGGYFSNDEWKGVTNDTVRAIANILRHRLGMPLRITSGLRPGDSGTHGKGLALDVQGWNGWGWSEYNEAVKILKQLGVKRIGRYIRNGFPVHIHFDIDFNEDYQGHWNKDYLTKKYLSDGEFKRLQAA